MESPPLAAQNNEEDVVRKGAQSEQYLTFDPLTIKERHSHATPQLRHSRLTCRQADYYASMIAFNVTEQTDIAEIEDRYKELQQQIESSDAFSEGLDAEIEQAKRNQLQNGITTAYVTIKQYRQRHTTFEERMQIISTQDCEQDEPRHSFGRIEEEKETFVESIADLAPRRITFDCLR